MTDAIPRTCAGSGILLLYAVNGLAGWRATKIETKNREKEHVSEIRSIADRDSPVRWPGSCDDAPQSFSQLCPFSNLLGWLGQSNMRMPRDKWIKEI